MRSLNKAALLSFTTLAAPQPPAPAPTSSAAAPADGHDLQDFLQPLPPTGPFPQPEAGAAAPSEMANGHDPIPQPISAASALLPDSQHLPNGTHSRSGADEPANGHASTVVDAAAQSATAASHGSQLPNGQPPANVSSMGQASLQSSANCGLNGHADLHSGSAPFEGPKQASSITANGLQHPGSTANGGAGNGVVSTGHGQPQEDGLHGQQDMLIVALDRASLGTGGPLFF